MTYKEIFEYKGAVPFRPFQIRMNSGRTFDVRHPENIHVGENAVVIFKYSSENDRIFERFQTIGLSLVKSIEHIDSPVAQD